jgi:hypothetical protein
MSSLFEVRRRLKTSATAISTCGQPNLGSLFLAGTMASTTFLFVRTTPLSRAVMRGEPRSVHPTTPVLVPPADAGFPNRDAEKRASPPRCYPTVHSED